MKRTKDTKKLLRHGMDEFFDPSEIEHTVLESSTTRADGYSFEWEVLKREEKMENLFLDCFLAYDLARFRADNARPYTGFDCAFYLSGFDIKDNSAKNLCNFITHFKLFIEDYGGEVVTTMVPYMNTGDIDEDTKRFGFTCDIVELLGFKSITNYCMNKQGAVYLYPNSTGIKILEEIDYILDDPAEATNNFDVMNESNLRSFGHSNSDMKLFYIVHDSLNSDRFALNDIAALVYTIEEGLNDEAFGIESAIEIRGFEKVDFSYNCKKAEMMLKMFTNRMEEEYNDKFIFFSQLAPSFDFLTAEEEYKYINIDEISADYQISNYGNVLDAYGNQVQWCNSKSGPVVLLEAANGEMCYYSVAYLLMSTFHPSFKYNHTIEFNEEMAKLTRIFIGAGFLDINNYSRFEYSTMFIFAKDKNDMLQLEEAYEKLIEKGDKE